MVTTPSKLQANRFVVIDAADYGVEDPRQLFMLEAMNDQFVIEEDKFKTGYECKTCEGEGYVDLPCPMCVGRSYDKGIEATDDTGDITRCRLCNRGRGVWDLVKGLGHQTCPTCEGKGATVLIPQTSERRPTSGILRSMGPSCSPCPVCVTKVRLESGEIINKVKTHWELSTEVETYCDACKNSRKTYQVGQRLLYAVFSGTAIDFKQKGVIRIMHENEVMCRIWGAANLGDIVK